MDDAGKKPVRLKPTGFWWFAGKIQLANLFTTARMVGAVYVAYLLWLLATGKSLGWPRGEFNQFWAVAWLFIFVALSDAVDGFVARRSKETALGKFLDPLSDKVLIYTVLFAMSLKLYPGFVWYWAISVLTMAALDIVSTLKYLYDVILGAVKKDFSGVKGAVDYGKRKFHFQVVVVSLCLATFCPIVDWSGSLVGFLSNLIIVPLSALQPLSPLVVMIATYYSAKSLAKKFGWLTESRRQISEDPFISCGMPPSSKPRKIPPMAPPPYLSGAASNEGPVSDD